MRTTNRLGSGRVMPGWWRVSLITGALACGLAIVPAGPSTATPPPDPNATECLRDTLCCCLGSRGSVGGEGERQPAPGGSGSTDAGNPVVRQPTNRQCYGTAGNRHEFSRGAAADSSSAIGSDRPRRRATALPRPHVLYMASILSPDEVFLHGFSSQTQGLGISEHGLGGDNSQFTTPTARPARAREDAISLGFQWVGGVSSDGIYFRRGPSSDPRPVWVYEVRADGAFYDLSESRLFRARPHQYAALSDWAPENVFLRANSDACSIALELAKARLAQEWTAFDIPAANILRAFPITRHTPVPSPSVSASAVQLAPPFPLETAQDNGNFVRLDTRGSDQLLIFPNE